MVIESFAFSFKMIAFIRFICMLIFIHFPIVLGVLRTPHAGKLCDILWHHFVQPYASMDGLVGYLERTTAHTAAGFVCWVPDTLHQWDYLSCSEVALKSDDYFQQHWQEDRDALEWFQPRANPRMQILASNHVPTSRQEFLSPTIFVSEAKEENTLSVGLGLVASVRAAGSTCGLL